MAEEKGITREELVLEFITKWPLERIKTMNIDEYILDKDALDSFCFDLEIRYDSIGSIKGNNALKFGIYKKFSIGEIKLKEGTYIANDIYVWKKALGETVEDAFENLRTDLIKIIENAQEIQNSDDLTLKLNDIEKINSILNFVKYKIFYLYSKGESILSVFANKQLQVLARLLKYEGKDVSNPALYRFLISKRTENETVSQLSDRLWELLPQKEKAPKKSKNLQNVQPEITDTTQKTPTNSDSQSLSKFPLNLILFGPPGTGKTYSTKTHALERVLKVAKITEEQRTKFKDYLIDFSDKNNNGQIAFTTFHQSMTYEDFVEGIKPVNPKEGDTYLKYETQPGIFKRMCHRAKENPTSNFVLIIDEINRGDVSKIFGELITLIEEDKRVNVRPEVDKKEYETIMVTLPYSKKPFKVPNNLYIIGTMNTADRSVEALDTALRRRFSFEELMPKYDIEVLKNEVMGNPLKNILYTINQRIKVLLDRDHQIGHSYFLKVEKEKSFLEVMYNNIIPLLQEYFYNDYEKIMLVLGVGFVISEEKKVSFPTFEDSFKPEITDFESKKIFRIVDKKDIENNLADVLTSMNIQEYPKPNE